MRVKINNVPRKLQSGTQVIVGTEKDLEKRDEQLLIFSLVLDMPKFGGLYSELCPEYFWGMPKNSGVFVRVNLPTKKVAPEFSFPGDIDLLLLPYEDQFLVLDQMVFLEAKVIRASYKKQSKSPNQFGISQAKGLYEMGVPYAGIIHLIVSDDSPKDQWRKASSAVLKNSTTGELSDIKEIDVDMLPVDLINRAYGRLSKATNDSPELGFGVCYLGSNDRELINDRARIFMPKCKSLSYNTNVSSELQVSVAEYFNSNYSEFINIPRN